MSRFPTDSPIPTRGKEGGSVPADDGDGGPDDESDGEAGGVDKGGSDGVEGGWGRRAGGWRRKRNEKAEEQRNGERTGEEMGKVRKIIESRKEGGKIKIGHNNKKFMALSPPFRPNP